MDNQRFELKEDTDGAWSIYDSETNTFVPSVPTPRSVVGIEMLQELCNAMNALGQ